MYSEILRFKIYIENCAKSKWEEQKKNGRINLLHVKIIHSLLSLKGKI